MEIKKIILRTEQATLFSNEKEIIFDGLDNKKINIFFMPNTSWKSLIFNWLEHLFSFNKDKYIKNTNKDLELEIYFLLDWNEYIYKSNYNTSYKIYLNWELVKWFDKILEKYVWINEWKLEYYWNSKNTLYSINRFNFLDFEWIKDDESSNEVPFIDSRFDWMSKKFILAYTLWADIDNSFFKLITEFEYKKEFIRKNRTRFEKYSNNLNQISLIEDNLKSLFFNLEDNRIVYWDISVAIKELKILIEEYIVAFWNSKHDEDYVFLVDEVKQLENIKDKIKKDISDTKEKIKWTKLWESKSLVESNILKTEDSINFNKYVDYKEDIKKINDLKISNYVSKNIDPFIKEFKYFLIDLYNIFIDNAIKNKLLNKDNLFEKDNINFKEDTLTIEALFKTSEWMRKTIRILTFIWLHIFANKEKTKCLDYSFYDSFIENIDSIYRDILFESIFEFISKNEYELPKMFFFITNIEVDWKESSIIELEKKYSKYINLIKSYWIK